jgi:hypothetical protein
MKKVFHKHPFFLLLFPVFIVLHIEKGYHHLINYHFVYKNILILFIVPFFVFIICYTFSRSYLNAGVQSFFLLFVFYFFGPIKDFLRLKFTDGLLQSYTFLLPVTALIITLILFQVRKRERFEKFTLFLNTTLIILILIDVTALLFQKNKENQNDNSISQSFVPCKDCHKPDIYYLIFDSYSSSNLLKQEFSFNNAVIDSYLIKKGFKTVPYSRSNYNLTPFSIGSTFNLNYLPGVDTSRDYFLKNYLPVVEKVYSNQLLSILEKEGYSIYNHSIFNIASHSSTVPPFDIWEINTLYDQHNIFLKIYADIGWQFPKWLRLPGKNKLKEYSENRDVHDSITIEHILNTVRLESEKPKFVYGHIFVPHSPYTYNSRGDKIQPVPNMKMEEDKAAYIEQIVYTNTIIKKLVDTIFDYQKNPFILIIQGDHGYRFFDRTKSRLEFPNFNAIYFSDKNYSLLNDSLTNVNLFRIVFNKFFNQNYPMLKDHVNFLKYK